jgi:hypothetical protein
MQRLRAVKKIWAVRKRCFAGMKKTVVVKQRWLRLVKNKRQGGKQEPAAPRFLARTPTEDKPALDVSAYRALEGFMPEARHHPRVVGFHLSQDHFPATHHATHETNSHQPGHPTKREPMAGYTR